MLSTHSTQFVPSVSTQSQQFVALSDQNKSYFKGIEVPVCWRVNNVCSGVEMDREAEVRTIVYDEDGLNGEEILEREVAEEKIESRVPSRIE